MANRSKLDCNAVSCAPVSVFCAISKDTDTKNIMRENRRFFIFFSFFAKIALKLRKKKEKSLSSEREIPTIQEGKTYGSLSEVDFNGNSKVRTASTVTIAKKRR